MLAVLSLGAALVVNNHVRVHSPAPHIRSHAPVLTAPAETQSADVATLECADDRDELRDALFERLEQMSGIWYSDDFYGAHGREWVDVSATLVGAGSAALVAVKVTGDANVPSGYTTWRTRGLPTTAGPSVPAEIQVRADPRDPNGFSWVPGDLVLVSEDSIVLTAVWSALQRSRGTFHRHRVDEGA
jgi:hypothetical protein